MLVARFTTTDDAGTKIIDWGTVWMYPAIFAAVVLVIFVALFKDRITPAPDSGTRIPDPRNRRRTNSGHKLALPMPSDRQ